MVSLTPTYDRAQQDHRPILIVSPTAFNHATKLPIILPLTNGGDFARRCGFVVEIKGIKTTGLVRCDQPRVLDITERGGHKVEDVPTVVIEDVVVKLATIRSWAATYGCAI